MNVLKLFVDCIKKKAFIKSVEGHIKKLLRLTVIGCGAKALNFTD